MRWRKPHLRTPGYIFGLVGAVERDCVVRAPGAPALCTRGLEGRVICRGWLSLLRVACRARGSRDAPCVRAWLLSCCTHGEAAEVPYVQTRSGTALTAPACAHPLCAHATGVLVQTRPCQGTSRARAQGRFADPERLAFREAGPRQPLYRVRFDQARPARRPAWHGPWPVPLGTAFWPRRMCTGCPPGAPTDLAARACLVPDQIARALLSCCAALSWHRARWRRQVADNDERSKSHALAGAAA